MHRRRLAFGMSLLLFLFAPILTGADTSKPTGVHWEMQGDLTEACTCNVPCTCNFGQGPSPRHYCWSVFSLDIQKGHYGNVKLDGLHLASAHGKKVAVWYIDEQATPEQATALKAVAARISKDRHFKVYLETARIIQEVGEKGNRLQIGDKGGFETDYIMGLDGKTPVVVDNNTTWNIPRSIKGKTKRLHYKDRYGSKMDFSATNGNQGKFDWNDQTEHYF